MGIDTEKKSMTHVFDTAFGIEAASPAMRDIFEEVYQSDAAPADLGSYSFVSQTELAELSKALNLCLGDVFIDLACGTGGPGLWVSRETGAGMIGIDISLQAVSAARRRAQRFGLEGDGRFFVGTFGDTGLPFGSMDGALSIDAFWLSLDKGDSVQEISRILRPGKRVAMTNWEFDVPLSGFPPQIRNHANLFEPFGFETIEHRVVDNWETRQRAVYQLIRDRSGDILRELGEAVGGQLVHEAHYAVGLIDGTDYLSHARRVLYVAQKSKLP